MKKKDNIVEDVFFFFSVQELRKKMHEASSRELSYKSIIRTFAIDNNYRIKFAL